MSLVEATVLILASIGVSSMRDELRTAFDDLGAYESLGDSGVLALWVVCILLMSVVVIAPAQLIVWITA